jgi:hypothetical protein
MFTIEKGIPVPVRAPKVEYPLASLEVGDSFLVPVDFVTDTLEAKAGASKTVRTVASAAAVANKKDAGSKFAARKVVGGMRVWRTA